MVQMAALTIIRAFTILRTSTLLRTAIIPRMVKIPKTFILQMTVVLPVIITISRTRTIPGQWTVKIPKAVTLFEWSPSIGKSPRQNGHQFNWSNASFATPVQVPYWFLCRLVYSKSECSNKNYSSKVVGTINRRRMALISPSQPFRANKSW